jgi:ABC-type sugar transport system ATPase subunit
MIAVENLCVRASSFALHNVSFTVATGEYAALMGRSGSGKTTVLELICGLRSAESGEVRLLGQVVSHLRPGERGVGYLPDCAACGEPPGSSRRG